MKASPSASAPIDENTPLKPGEMKIDSPDGPIRITKNADGSSTMDMGPKGTIRQSMDAENHSLHLESSMVTMSGFADMLSAFLQMSGSGMQVIARTELEGNYQVSVDIAFSDLIAGAREQGFAMTGPPPGAEGSAASDPGGTTLFESVERMGSSWRSARRPCSSSLSTVSRRRRLKIDGHSTPLRCLNFLAARFSTATAQTQKCPPRGEGISFAAM
jgi:hypothetical protein